MLTSSSTLSRRLWRLNKVLDRSLHTGQHRDYAYYYLQYYMVEKMKKMDGNPFNRKTLTEDVLHEWQNMLNDTAEIFGVPAGLITRVDGKEIEILLSSETDDNPYPAAFISQYPNSGWYCEHTLKSRWLNLIPNALQNFQWKDNSAAIEMHMISLIITDLGEAIDSAL